MTKKLLIVTAVCAADYNLALKRATWMKELGQKPVHSLLLVNDGTIDDAALKSLAEAQTDVFESVLTRKIASPRSTAWPAGVNHVFRTIARNLISPGAWVDATLYQGWFYFEPDITPLAPTWANVLDSQYAFQKKPFMGVRSLVHAMRGKEPVTITCMNGAGCYPFDPQHFNPIMMLGEGAPWDVLGLSNRDHVIAYIPDEAYMLTYGITECARKEIGFRAKKTTQDGKVSTIEFVLKEQLLHHGCKDGSLIDLLSKPIKIPVPVVKPPERLLAALKYKSKKRMPKSAARAQNQKAEIIADRKNGMGWNDLIGKYRVNPKHLKAILTEGEVHAAA